MALLFCDSFDHYTVTSQAQRKGWSGNFLGAITGRNSTTGVSLNNADNTLVITAGASFVVGCAVYFSGGGTTSTIFRFADAGSNQCELNFGHADKSLYITRNGAYFGLTAPSAVNITGFQYIEFKLTINNSTGSIEVRVNGVVVLSSSSIDTQNTANASANQFILRGPGLTHFDDFYLASGTTYLGDVRVQAIYPDSAGNYTNWTPSAGSNYQCVDENPGNDDTDYVSSSTAGHKDSYNFGAVGITGSVKGIQTLISARKDDAGTRLAKRLMRISGTDYTGSDISLGTSYTYLRETFDTNPNTATDWTISDVDATEFGVELVS